MSGEPVSHILDAIPFELDLAQLMRRARVKEGSANAVELQRLAEEGAALARPKAAYRVAYINNRREDCVEIEGRWFSSRILAVNLQNAFRIFPYLATCGMELQEWAEGIEDMLHRFWAEALKEMALGAAMNFAIRHMDEQYRPGDTSHMSPGSLVDWPIQQQTVLFDLMGDCKQVIGVTLTESLLMVPTKTVSGIRFPTTTHFESCQLCPRENCPGRRAPYDPDLLETKYQ